VRQVADYVVVNVSSPNTAGLRSLQSPQLLEPLLSALLQERLAGPRGRPLPLLLKISPDLSVEELRDIASLLRRLPMDGVVATNTTLARDAVAHLPHGNEAGGLSGAPLLAASNRVVARLRATLGAGFPIIGVGGVTTPGDAIAKRSAGADIVQIYTGFIYHGPGLVSGAARALAAARPSKGAGR